METPNGIYKALASVNKEVNYIGKNRKNEQQNFNFRGIDDVMNELHTLFAKNEIVIKHKVLSYATDTVTSSRGTALYHTKANIKFFFIYSDSSKLKVTTVGEAMDSGDKGINKCLSIGLKNVLLQMFLIPTVEDKDPDSQAHEVKIEPVKAKVVNKPKPENNELLEDALLKAELAENEEILKNVWDSYPSMHKNDQFIKTVKAVKETIKSNKL